MADHHWRRKRNRIDGDAYRGAAAFAVTAATWRRQPVFADPVHVSRYRAMLYDAAATTGFRLLAYCFMPDHLHLLVEGSDGSDLATLMKRFKQASSYDFKQRTGTLLWQRSYYDHIVRGPQDLEAAIDYVLGNPVAAGLVADAADYPFTGGVVVDEEGRGDLKVAATNRGHRTPART